MQDRRENLRATFECVWNRTKYSYNGLNWRIRRKADTDTDGSLDQERLMYYSASWQLLEEDVDDDLDQTVDRHVQYVWGARYIDDIVMRREDRNNDGDYLDEDDLKRYYLTDVQFSVVAILNEAAQVIERVSYSPYGEARHHRMSDLNGDGMSTAADKTIIQNNDGNFGAGDLDRDGTVEYSSPADDWNLADDDSGFALSAGLLSYADEDNIIGYCGYLFNGETRHYHVRFRCYSPELGRWLERDSADSVSRLNLFEAVTSSPVRWVDPLGLDRCNPDLDDLMELIEKLGTRTFAGAVHGWQDADSLLWEIYYGLGYFECVIKCIEDDPEKLVIALAKAGWNLAKDEIVNLLELSTLLLLVEFDEDGNPQLDTAQLTEDILDKLGDFDDKNNLKSLDLFCEADSSLRDAIEQWARNGGMTPEDLKELQRKLKEVDSKARKRARRALRNKGAVRLGKTAAKGAGAAGAVLTTAELLARTVEELADQCKDRCKKPSPCGGPGD